MMRFDSTATAVILIDLQRWILAMPMAPHQASAIIPRATDLAGQLQAQGSTFVSVRVGFAPDYRDALRQPTDAGFSPPAGPFPPEALDIPDGLAALTPDVSILKRQWSAFFGTELDLQLRRRGISTLIIGGVMTNFGVESTARDGWQLGYSVVIAEDICAAPDAEMHAFAIGRTLPRVARVRSSAQILSGSI